MSISSFLLLKSLRFADPVMQGSAVQHSVFIAATTMTLPASRQATCQELQSAGLAQLRHCLDACPQLAR